MSQKNAADGKNIGMGAGAGAAIGAAIGVWAFGVGAFVGAAVGAVVGGIVGLFAGKKKKDVFGGLLEQYPDLVREGVDGWQEMNVEMARALIANNQVDAKTKEMLESAIAYNEQLQEAKGQITEGLAELAGNLGDNIRDALVTAFRDGTDAAEAFGKAVGDVIADMAAKLLFTALFKDAFDKLQAEMISSYSSIDGDQSILDDLTRFMQENKDKPEQYLEGLEAINKVMEQAGFSNILGKNAKDKTPLQGTITSASEESVSALNGNLTAVRIHVAETNANVRQSLFFLAGIETNTSETARNTARLSQIEAHLRDIKDNTKDNGGGNSPRSKGWDNLG